MIRLCWLAGALAACGTSTDDRPATLQYITEAVLAPDCGSAPCHSTFTQQVGDVFDTIKGARKSMVDNGLVVYPDDTANPMQARLVQAVTVGLPSILAPGSGNIRMPYDAPMPTEDIQLIKRWIASGALGSQCVPEEGSVCVGNKLTACDSDGNLGATIMVCTNACSEGACL